MYIDWDPWESLNILFACAIHSLVPSEENLQKHILLSKD